MRQKFDGDAGGIGIGRTTLRFLYLKLKLMILIRFFLRYMLHALEIVPFMEILDQGIMRCICGWKWRVLRRIPMPKGPVTTV